MKGNNRRFKKCTVTGERNTFQVDILTLGAPSLVLSMRNILTPHYYNRVPQEVLSLVPYHFGAGEESIILAPEAVGAQHFVRRSAGVSVISLPLHPATDVAWYPGTSVVRHKLHRPRRNGVGELF